MISNATGGLGGHPGVQLSTKNQPGADTRQYDPANESDPIKEIWFKGAPTGANLFIGSPNELENAYYQVLLAVGKVEIRIDGKNCYSAKVAADHLRVRGWA